MQQDKSQKQSAYYSKICDIHDQKSKIISLKLINESKQLISFGIEDDVLQFEQQDNNKWIQSQKLIENQQLQCCTYNKNTNTFFYAHKKGQIEEMYLDHNQQNVHIELISQSEGNQILELQFNENCNYLVESLCDFVVILSKINNVWQETDSLNEIFTEDQCIFVTSVSFNRFGNEIAIGFTDGHLSLWELSNNKWQQTQQFHLNKGQITKICYSSSKDILVVADKQGCLIFLEKNQQNQYILQSQYQSDQEQSINIIQFNKNSNILLVGESKMVKILKQAKNQSWVIMTKFQVNEEIYSFDISENNKYLCVGQNNGWISIFDYIGN